MKVITTIPPYAPFLPKLADHPAIVGVRLNTVMPIKGSLEDYLKWLKGVMKDKDIWIDLKCRQIRTSHGFFFKAPESGIRHYKIDGKDVILDPFSGVGTSCAVAKKMGRHYIGFELDSANFQKANERIESHKNKNL
jgi:site-specific DNA-methyltransferase (adenine-specific)